MTRKEVKAKILEKFGTLSNFCNLTRQNHNNLLRYLNHTGACESCDRGKKRRLMSLIEETDNPGQLGKDIVDTERLQIYNLIKKKYGSIEMGAKKTGLSVDYLHNLTQGRLNRDGSQMVKRKNQKYIKLVKILEG